MKRNSLKIIGGFPLIKIKMNKKNVLVPVKKILKSINSCHTDEQIKNCENLVQNYLKSAKKHGVLNVNELSKRLNEELIDRQEALYLVKIFNFA